MKLTAANIPSLPEGQYVDFAYPGLNILVGKRRRTWYLRHRIGGVQKQSKLGYFPVLGLADARKAAAALAERIDHGAPAPLPPAHPRSDALTLGDLIDKYQRHRRQRGDRIKSLDEAMRAVRRGLAPYLGLPARDFSKADLRAARDKVALGSLSSSNQLLVCTGPILRWAAAEDLILHDFSREVLKVASPVQRERVLTPDEIAAVWRAAGEAGNYGRLVRFLLLVGCRLNEAATLKFGDIRNGVWHQTANKSDRAQTVKLPAEVLAIVGTGDPDAFVFPGRDGAMRAFSKFKSELDKASEVTDWVQHDLRRTCASGLQDLGVDRLVIDVGILNHSLPGVAGIYMRGQMEELKTEALRKWAAKVRFLVSGLHAVA